MEIGRRAYLAGAAGIAGLAGCLGGSDGDGEGETGTREHTTTDAVTATPTATPEPTETETPTGTGTAPDLPPPVLGNPDADVTVTVFEDFACPHCRQFALEVFPEIRRQYVDTGRIRYEHRDFPIPVDRRWSWLVPNAARAVQDREGDAAFFEYAKRLYENQDRYSLELLASLAGSVGADGDAVRNAAETGRYHPVIVEDRRLGEEMGLRGTPEVYVNGARIGRAAAADIRGAIEAEL